jgi:hypothetical protein
MRALRLTQFETPAAALAIARVPLPAIAVGGGAPRARDLAAVEGALPSDWRNVADRAARSDFCIGLRLIKRRSSVATPSSS